MLRRLMGAGVLGCMLSAGASAEVVGHWRFEGAGATSEQFVADASGKGHTLTRGVVQSSGEMATNAGPAQVALPASGAGSQFPRTDGNGNAAQWSGTASWAFSLNDTPSLPAGTMTIEAYVNLSAQGPKGGSRTIASQGSGYATVSGGWSLMLAGEESPRGVGDVLFQTQFASDAPAGSGWVGGNVDTWEANNPLQTNRDYYVAVVYQVAETDEQGRAKPNTGKVLIYVKDLSDPAAPLQVTAHSHSRARMVNSTAPLRIGNLHSSGSHGQWNGLIDEVRLSSRALEVAELMVFAQTQGR